MAWYFWRWVTWKVFDSPSAQGRGVATFVTTAAYLRGTAFKGMRKYLRRIYDEGRIIDLSPEGMRPDVATRIVPKVQHPLAVCDGPLITVDDLTLARVLPVPDSQRVLVSGPPAAEQGEMHYTS